MRSTGRAMVAVLAVAAVAAAGCVSTEEVGGSDKPTPPTTAVTPEIGAFNTDVTSGGIMATVVDVKAFDQSAKGVPRITVVMRTENLTDHVTHNPDVALRCDESARDGDWYRGSSWEPNAELPVNVVSQGEVIVGFPLKGDNPEYPVVTCTRPTLRVTIEGVRGERPSVTDVAVPDSVIAEAVRRPRGPVLPTTPESE